MLRVILDALWGSSPPDLDLEAKALGAIDTMLSIAGWTLGVLGVILAVVAFFGWAVLNAAAKAAGRARAEQQVKGYLGGKEFRDLLELEVRKRVDAIVEERVVSTYISTEPDGDGEDAFPPAIQGGADDPG